MPSPTLVWFRRDLRLADHPALAAAVARGGPVIPVFVLDPLVERWGAAAKWRLDQGLASFASRLSESGSRLVLRRGAALEVLRALVAETGARAIFWTRLYDRPSTERDAAVKAALKGDGLEARSFPGHLLHEPWEIATGAGGCYRVYTPFARAAFARPVAEPLPAPARLPAPAAWPVSDDLAAWGLGRGVRRGAAVLARHARVGEAAARDRLDRFLRDGVSAYAARRDRMDLAGCSGLSENLALGEISPRTVWTLTRAAAPSGEGPETFLKEIVWREFAWHLLHHTPALADRNWRPEWDAFPWRADNPDAERWRRGLTGEPAIDAAMREMYVTGRMHNRARMLAASYLTKHLLTDWRVGEAWFRECLTDWDPASNAMGWQWAAGSGPDAAPFFRIFNPATQAERFDPEGRWRRRWVAEIARPAGAEALSYFDMVPERWELRPDAPYPAPLVDLKVGRERALAAYKRLRDAA